MLQSSLILLFVLSLFTFAKTPKKPKRAEYWHTTHALEKFPCMTPAETDYFQRLIHIQKSEEKTKIFAEHKAQLNSIGRSPSSIQTSFKLNSQKYICPPFHGVRNPHPQKLEFGKASPFERLIVQKNSVLVANGLNRNEVWKSQLSANKSYLEGSNPRGTPFHLMPLVPPQNEKVRFLVHYQLWQDKTPPTLTLCYREDLHNQCNPYKETTILTDSKQP